MAEAAGRPGTFLAGAGVAAAGLVLVVWTRLGHPDPGDGPNVSVRPDTKEGRRVLRGMRAR